MPLSDDDLEPRLRERMQQEMTKPTRWWYLSFADESGWKGACIVPAKGIMSATLVCNRLKINPGGEIRAVPFHDSALDLIAPELRGRLLTREDLERHFDGAVDWENEP